MTNQIQIEIIYIGSPNGTGENAPIFHWKNTVLEGKSIAEALEQSGIYPLHPETTGFSVGIFSKQKPLDTLLKSGDRIEIYRPLALDPKEQRRKRA